MTEPKFTYDVKRVSRETLEASAEFDMEAHTDGNCGNIIQRIFDEARVPVTPTVAQLESRLASEMIANFYDNKVHYLTTLILDIEAARKREAGQ